jgi:2-keto-4-pentenoate hydratase/2-oxohepta-3-ene-1,7-dioic acid hydratase in catechol pathway
MRLVTYEADRRWRAGILIDARVIDLAAAGLPVFPESDTPISNRAILQLTPAERSALEEAARELLRVKRARRHVLALEDLRLGPPIPDPDKIICLGLNYRSHAEEAGLAVPEVPILFGKYRNALIGAAGPIVLPAISKQIDYEGELAVVIGKRCKDVPAAQALDCVGGYMAFNDVSARDLQMRTGQWLSGKSLDTFAPCGPALVLDEIEDPQSLDITTRVNGQILQQSNTRHMIFNVAEIIAYVSRLMTLEPGDILATGTPEGVGFKRQPPIFLHDGDLVEVEVEKIGTLRNPVVQGE